MSLLSAAIYSTVQDSSSTARLVLSEATEIPHVLAAAASNDFYGTQARIPRVTAAVVTCVVVIMVLLFIYVLLALVRCTLSF